MLDPRLIGQVQLLVGEDDFDVPACRAVYKAMLKLSDRGEPIDSFALLESQLRADDEWGLVGLERLGALTKNTSSHHADAHATAIRAAAERRRRIATLTDALQLERCGQDSEEVLAELGIAAPSAARVESELRAENRALRKAVHAARDLRKLVNGAPEAEAFDAAAAATQKAPAATAAAEDVEVVCMADVEPSDPPWLWEGRVALKTITLLVGDPGLGKSTVLLDLAARVSTGRPFPGPTERREPAGVVLLGAEDALDFVVRPRLDALDADVSRIYVIKAVLDKRRRRPVSLETDLQRVEEVLENFDARLFIIDPLSAYMGRNVNTWKDSDVRAIMDPIADMSERRSLATIGLLHLNKATERDALHRSQGSTAFVAAARSVLALAPDPDDADHKTRRVLVHIKCNFAPKADARMLDVTPPMRWLEERPDVKASQALTPRREEKGAADRRACEEVIRQVLADGPLPASEARAKVHELLPDATDRTIDRARAAAGVEFTRPTVVGGEWTWSLPGGETGSGETGGSRRNPPSEGIRPSRQGENGVARRADRVGEANGGHPPVSPLPVSPPTETAPDLPDPDWSAEADFDADEEAAP
jgi:hypothetical protein